ncbi:hypothetical protein TRFO_16071 [Tritrichomonas foetus]|uniref:Uncharacterized protein n=1 Tax=Tritrichomonas foetus TaxID=1144522 RepID=A0A1J4KVL9_9EUKA|nr:hypothetical protein TRFO_16071 [Tritrichomonas foetus]|eukprot:OHT13742.1 hypothetical protein TRFO_16071 [Tritrichomonas foetus]
MSELLKEIIGKVRNEKIPDRKDISKLSMEEKLQLEDDLVKIIKLFKEEAVLEISLLQRRLMKVNRELLLIEQEPEPKQFVSNKNTPKIERMGIKKATETPKSKRNATPAKHTPNKYNTSPPDTPSQNNSKFDVIQEKISELKEKISQMGSNRSLTPKKSSPYQK